jgi:hypothetical protein
MGKRSTFDWYFPGGGAVGPLVGSGGKLRSMRGVFFGELFGFIATFLFLKKLHTNDTRAAEGFRALASQKAWFLGKRDEVSVR